LAGGKILTTGSFFTGDAEQARQPALIGRRSKHWVKIRSRRLNETDAYEEEQDVEREEAVDENPSDFSPRYYPELCPTRIIGGVCPFSGTA